MKGLTIVVFLLVVAGAAYGQRLENPDQRPSLIMGMGYSWMNDRCETTVAPYVIDAVRLGRLIPTFGASVPVSKHVTMLGSMAWGMRRTVGPELSVPVSEYSSVSVQRYLTTFNIEVAVKVYLDRD